jgi:hypothetical protein
VDRLLDDYTDGQIALILNERGLRSGTGAAFNLNIIEGICRSYRLKSRYHRLRERGLLNVNEMADLLGICTVTVNAWRKRGIVRGFACNDRKEYLFDPPGPIDHLSAKAKNCGKDTRLPGLYPIVPKRCSMEYSPLLRHLHSPRPSGNRF